MRMGGYSAYAGDNNPLKCEIVQPRGAIKFFSADVGIFFGGGGAQKSLHIHESNLCFSHFMLRNVQIYEILSIPSADINWRTGNHQMPLEVLNSGTVFRSAFSYIHLFIGRYFKDT